MPFRYNQLDYYLLFPQLLTILYRKPLRQSNSVTMLCGEIKREIFYQCESFVSSVNIQTNTFLILRNVDKRLRLVDGSTGRIHEFSSNQNGLSKIKRGTRNKSFINRDNTESHGACIEPFTIRRS